jgi:Ca-activated chloride channel family protein
MSEFELLRPLFLLLLIPGWLLLLGLYRWGQWSSPWRGLIDEDLLPHVVADSSSARSQFPIILMAMIWLVACLALSGPSIRHGQSDTLLQLQARVIVLDLSATMNSPDLPPNRLSRAKFKIRDMLEQTPERVQLQFGLVVFAGDAFMVSPITDDIHTLLNLLNSLSTQVVPVPGDRADLAVEMAVELIRNSGGGGEIALLTDGVSELTGPAIAEAEQLGIRTSIIEVGTKQGAPIPLADGGFLKDADGSIVLAGTPTAKLAELARLGRGIFTPLAADNNDIDAINRWSGSFFDSEYKDAGQKLVLRQDLGAWLALLLMPLILPLFRRGWMLLLIMTVVTPAEKAMAFTWEDLWLRSDQQEAQQFESGDFSGAAGGSTDWSAAASYRNEDFQSASDKWQQRTDSEGLYNLGNAQAKAGQLEDALESYRAALKMNADFEDAQFNKKLVEDLLEQTDNNQKNESGDGEQQDSESDQHSNQQQSDSEDSSSKSGEDSQQGENQQQSQDESAGEQSAEEQQSEQARQEQQESETNGEENESANQSEEMQSAMDQESDKQAKQALEQWLRKIPDDPEGLLRRKFRYQYEQRSRRDRG